MSKSKIEWTDQTWNPIIGCSKISEGCNNCYAERMAYRLAHMEMSNNENQYNYANVIDFKSKTWNGKTHFAKSQLLKPIKRKKPTRYFVCSMGDLFHESVSFNLIIKIFDIMYRTPRHTYQVLTKRPDRMLEFFKYCGKIMKHVGFDSIPSESGNMLDYMEISPNIWLGVTAENQEQANKRIPVLLDISAKVRFVSIEPMLNSVDLTNLELSQRTSLNALNGEGRLYDQILVNDVKLDWVICGGESGHNARPMHPDWVRNLIDQCKEADIPFFFKQWGEWIGSNCNSFSEEVFKYLKGKKIHKFSNGIQSFKVGKKIAGCSINSKQYKEYPTAGNL